MKVWLLKYIIIYIENIILVLNYFNQVSKVYFDKNYIIFRWIRHKWGKKREFYYSMIIISFYVGVLV